jgi:hypothetical protein
MKRFAMVSLLALTPYFALAVDTGNLNAAGNNISSPQPMPQPMLQSRYSSSPVPLKLSNNSPPTPNMPNAPAVQQPQQALKKTANSDTVQKNMSLQAVINSLSDQDRKVILEIQQEISTWSQDVIHELTNYREFVLNAREEAEKKYNALTPQAKQALKIESDLKSKLSTGAIEKLDHVNRPDPALALAPQSN